MAVPAALALLLITIELLEGMETIVAPPGILVPETAMPTQ